jgi:hypothetical protein
VPRPERRHTPAELLAANDELARADAARGQRRTGTFDAPWVTRPPDGPKTKHSNSLGAETPAGQKKR